MSDFESPILEAKDLQRAVNTIETVKADTLTPPTRETVTVTYTDDIGRVVCLDCGWQGNGFELLAQACPVCDGRCADV